MYQAHAHRNGRVFAITLAAITMTMVSVWGVRLARAQSKAVAPSSLGDSELVAQYRRVEVASVSDALEQVTGKRMYMTHHMQPISRPSSLDSRELFC